MIANDFGIPYNSTMTRKSQTNTIVERVCQTIGNIIHIFEIQQMNLDNKNPREGILSSTVLAMRSTVHTATQHSPSQLIFSRDVILNINKKANW